MTESLYAKAINLVYYAEEEVLAAVAVEVAKSNPSVFLKGYDNARRTHNKSLAEQTIYNLVATGEYVKAIKMHRETHGTTLGEAKTEIDSIREELNLSKPNG